MPLNHRKFELPAAQSAKRNVFSVNVVLLSETVVNILNSLIKNNNACLCPCKIAEQSQRVPWSDL